MDIQDEQTQEDSFDQYLRIKINSLLVSFQVCQIYDNIHKLSQHEFNEPNPKSFFLLNQVHSWNHFLSNVPLDSGSLQHTGTWRCKEYSYYNDADEFFAITQQSKLNIFNYFKEFQWLQQIKKDLKNIEFTSFSSQGKLKNRLEIIQQINLQQVTVPTNYNFLINNRNINENFYLHKSLVKYFKINRNIEGTGLHQRLFTKIEFDDFIDKCQIYVIDYLDIYTYVDKDEIDRLNEEQNAAQYSLMTIIDIERPNILSNQHAFISRHKGTQTRELNYDIPYHFRYQMADTTNYKKSYIPYIPSVFVQCSDDQDNKVPTKQTFEQNLLKEQFGVDKFREFYLHKSQENIEQLYYNVPVGLIEHKQIITVTTIGITIGLSLFLVKTIFQEQKYKIQ